VFSGKIDEGRVFFKLSYRLSQFQNQIKKMTQSTRVSKIPVFAFFLSSVVI
jgi:hypothetical protein